MYNFQFKFFSNLHNCITHNVHCFEKPIQVDEEMIIIKIKPTIAEMNLTKSSTSKIKLTSYTKNLRS